MKTPDMKDFSSIWDEKAYKIPATFVTVSGFSVAGIGFHTDISIVLPFWCQQTIRMGVRMSFSRRARIA